MKKEINPKISEHFRKLGEKSWKIRQQKILEQGNTKENKVNSKKNSSTKPQKKISTVSLQND